MYRGFVKEFQSISRSLPNKTKLKLDQDFCFSFELLNESKFSMPWVRCSFVGNAFCCILLSQIFNISQSKLTHYYLTSLRGGGPNSANFRGYPSREKFCQIVFDGFLNNGKNPLNSIWRRSLFFLQSCQFIHIQYSQTEDFILSPTNLGQILNLTQKAQFLVLVIFWAVAGRKYICAVWQGQFLQSR